MKELGNYFNDWYVVEISNLPKDFTVNPFMVERDEWCRETIGKRGIIWWSEYRNGVVRYSFKYENDAAVFKIGWG